MVDTSLNIDLLNQAFDALRLRNRLTSMNIANMETPGYKRQAVNFEQAFIDAVDTVNRTGQRTDLQIEVNESDQAPVLEEELMALADTQARSQMIVRSVRDRFDFIKTAIRSR